MNNWISRIASWFTPAPSAGGYDGAVDSRRRKQRAWNRARPLDEDRLIGPRDRESLRLECSDLRRNDAIVAGVCERLPDNIVGPSGIVPQAKTSDNDWNDTAEAWWHEWNKIMDFRRRVNGREFQRLIIQSRLISGESGFILLDNGQVQPIEAERIKTPTKMALDPTMCEGIKVTPQGIPMSYYIGRRDTQGRVDPDQFNRVERENFIHCYRPIRFDQLRGIPELAPVINSLRDFSKLTGETLNKAVLDALHAWVVTSDDGASKIANQLGPRNATSAQAEELQKYEFMEGGMTYYLGKGEDVKSLASQTPNSTYVAFNELILRIIGAALSIPYEFLVLDFKGGSFSASRAALMQTYRTFQMWQGWLVDTYLQRLWNWRIAKAIKAGELPPAPLDKNGVSEWYRVDWVGPDYGWIDPQKEAVANIYEYALGVSSVTDIARKSKGQDAEDIFRRKGADYLSAARVVKETNAQLEGMGLEDRITLSHIIHAKSPPFVPDTSLEQPQQRGPNNEE